jgi:hypothetical protein
MLDITLLPFLAFILELTAAGAANGFLLGDPALFRFGNKPAFAADIAKGAGAGYCFAEAAE